MTGYGAANCAMPWMVANIWRFAAFGPLFAIGATKSAVRYPVAPTVAVMADCTPAPPVAATKLAGRRVAFLTLTKKASFPTPALFLGALCQLAGTAWLVAAH